MSDFYLLIITLAFYFYMDKKEKKKNIRWMKKGRVATFSFAASMGNVFVVVKKRYLLFIRFVKRITYDDFDIPAFSLDKKIFSPAF